MSEEQVQKQKKKYCIGQWIVNINDPIGTGSFGAVYNGYNKKDSTKVAIKIQYLDQLKNLAPNKKWKDFIQREISINKSSTSPNIVKFIDDGKTKDDKKQSLMFLVMELCDKETLKDKLKAGPFQEKEAKQIFQNIMNGYAWINSQDGIHRDLKPENILFKDGIAKIGDFGLSRINMLQEQAQPIITVLGTSKYRAPELLTHKENIQLESPEKIDIWSLGLILFEMIYSRLPWNTDNSQDKNNFEMANYFKDLESKRLQFPTHINQKPIEVSALAKDLIQNMLEVDAQNRYSFKQCLQHPYLNQ